MIGVGFFGSLLGRRYQRHIQLAYGERRVRAAKLAGLTEIPIEIRTLSDEDMFNIAIVENEQRQDLTQLEVGEALERAMAQFDMSERDIAARLGKSKGYVHNRIELARLPDDLKAVLRRQTLESFSPSHARELVRIVDQSLRITLTQKVLDEFYNFQQTKEAVDQALGISKPVEVVIISPQEPISEEIEDEDEDVIVTKAPRLRQERERAHGIARLRQQGEQLLETIAQLATDERTNREELQAALEQIYSAIVQWATRMS